MPELALVIGALLLVAGATGCPSCRTQLRELALRQIKQQILSRLGLERAPNITGRPLPRIPPLEHLYDQFQGDQPPVEEEEPLFSLERVVAFAQSHPKMRHLQRKELLYFKFSEKLLENRIVKAYLWLFTKSTTREDSPPLHITVYKVTSEDPPVLTPVTSVKEARARSGRGRWVSIDVKRPMAEWFKSPEDSLGLAIQAEEQGSQEPATQRLVVTSIRDSSSYKPFLEVEVASVKKKRMKRDIGLNCFDNSEETRCCRYPLTVDFESFGWDWVVAPKRYEANYCSGECPHVFLQQSTHTHIAQLANSSAGPCCAPHQMSSIIMIYFPDNTSSNILYGKIPGMVVERCGCS